LIRFYSGGGRVKFAPVVVLGGILTSALLDQIVTPPFFFYKFGKPPTADKIIVEREGRAAGRKTDGAKQTFPPFSQNAPKPV